MEIIKIQPQHSKYRDPGMSFLAQKVPSVGPEKSFRTGSAGKLTELLMVKTIFFGT